MEPWVQTYTAKKVFPLDVKPGDFNILDCAHSLAGQRRYLAHTSPYYSTAQHCVMAVRFFNAYEDVPDDEYERVIIELQLLFHDASEIYFCDIPGPCKHLVQVKVGDSWMPYSQWEDDTLAVIFTDLGIPLPVRPVVKVVDHRMVFTEKRDLLLPEPAVWNHPVPPYPTSIHGPESVWTDYTAETRFLELAHRLLSKKLEIEASR